MNDDLLKPMADSIRNAIDKQIIKDLLNMSEDSSVISPYKVIRATELGVVGTPWEIDIRNSKCIICGMDADREVWTYYQKASESPGNRIKKVNHACSEECAEWVGVRG